jgi:dihydrofolate reductase
MAKVRIASIGLSIDGFVAGPDQSLDHPLGVGGEALHDWAFETRSFRKMIGREGGESGADDRIWAEGFADVGAWIIGRNMFGPDRGPWGPDPWRGWWGEEPPYHRPVVVLTRHPREDLVMQGGTVFHFETGGIEAALARAVEAAEGRDVRIGGGAETLRQYLRASLVDEMRLALAPSLLGRGEALFQGLDLAAAGYRCDRATPGERATHLFFSRAEKA